MWPLARSRRLNERASANNKLLHSSFTTTQTHPPQRTQDEADSRHNARGGALRYIRFGWNDKHKQKSQAQLLQVAQSAEGRREPPQQPPGEATRGREDMRSDDVVGFVLLIVNAPPPTTT